MSERQATRFAGKHAENMWGAGLLVLIGAGVVFRSIAYDVGTLANMGPGFFPAMLGALLIVIGAAMFALGSKTPSVAAYKREGLDLRGCGCIVLGILAFVTLGKYGGLIPATFSVVFLSALGDRSNTLTRVACLALAMVAVCVMVFHWGLHIQFPLFAWGE